MLHTDIVPAVSLPTHALNDASLFEPLPPFLRRIQRPLVGMEAGSLQISKRERFVQCLFRKDPVIVRRD